MRHGRASMRRGLSIIALGVLGGAVLAIAAASAGAQGVGPQSPGTLGPLDPVYHTLERLDAFGLVPRSIGAHTPYSFARVARVAEEVRRHLTATDDLGPQARADIEALLAELDERVHEARASPVRGILDVEAGGGRSPGRSVPDNGLGSWRAVVNPLWSGRGGRAYGDRASIAMSARVAGSVGGRLALGAAVRGSAGRYSGVEPGRRDGTVEALYARLALGGFAVEAGRDALWIPGQGGRGLLLSENGPPVDQLRVSTERPLSLFLFGDTELTFLAADLGADQHFPHTKLFGVLASATPVEGLDLGLTLLNKQLGEGAPGATTKDRILDLTWVWDWFRDENYTFSDKLVGASARVRAGGVFLRGEAAFTDFDQTRLWHTFRGTAGYRIGVEAPTLGPSGRHQVGIEASLLGPHLYRHHQYLDGESVDGFAQGATLSPDSRGLSATYAYDVPTAGWHIGARGTYESRSGDTWTPAPADPGGRITRREDVPDEERWRAEVTWHGALFRSSAGVELRAGVEHIRNFAFADGDTRNNGAVLVRLWRAF